MWFKRFAVGVVWVSSHLRGTLQAVKMKAETGEVVSARDCKQTCMCDIIWFGIFLRKHLIYKLFRGVGGNFSCSHVECRLPGFVLLWKCNFFSKEVFMYSHLLLFWKNNVVITHSWLIVARVNYPLEFPLVREWNLQ